MLFNNGIDFVALFRRNDKFSEFYAGFTVLSRFFFFVVLLDYCLAPIFVFLVVSSW
jgi:hypothetical protein